MSIAPNGRREAITGGRPWPAHYTFVPAVRVGDTVWISGTTATDETGRIVAPGDIVGQTRQIYRKFHALLASMGGSCDDIVATTDYFTTTENFAGTAAVRREFFRNALPSSTGVQVAALLRKEALIEISAIAVLRSSGEPAPGRSGRMYFEDFHPGAHFATTGRTVTDADHEAFCRLTGYALPLFLDDAAARASGLPGRICPSHLIMSFTSPMSAHLLEGGLIALLGIDNARFLAIVRPGDTLRVDVEVLERRAGSTPGRGVVVLRDHVHNQRGEEVFRNDKLLMRKRDTA